MTVLPEIYFYSKKMYYLLHLSASQTTTQAACVMPSATEHLHSGKQVPVEASGFMAGREPTIKRTALTKYDSVPFVRTKEPFKRIGSFANITSLLTLYGNIRKLHEARPSPLYNNECEGVRAFTTVTQMQVHESGLWLSQSGLLGASPDGLVGSSAVLEVKCPHGAREMTISEA